VQKNGMSKKNMIVRYSKKSLKKKTGKKTPGRIPQEPKEWPNGKDQYNFTDLVSRIMKTSGGFNRCYNAQAS
jgi:hypothetical protein